MKRSALFHLHLRIGAKFVEHHGWEMPLNFTLPELEASQVREHAGLTDLSYRTKFDTRAEPGRPFCHLGRDHYLVTGEPPFDPPSRSTDVTSVYGDFFLAGPRSKAILSKLTSLNLSDATLPNLSCAQASLAQVHTVVLREDIGSISGFHLLVSREHGESVWVAVTHAGQEFHLQPFGLRALELLRR